LAQHYSQSSVLQDQGYEFCIFEDFDIVAAFALGCCTDFEILDDFQSTGLFLKSKKKQTKFGFFQSERLDPENVLYEPHTDIHYKSLLY